MERRVSSLETKVAVLGTRQDTADAELSNVRADINYICSTDMGPTKHLKVALGQSFFFPWRSFKNFNKIK